jgi:aspartate racemase
LTAEVKNSTVPGVKTIGIIGGLAWPSTMDYYRLLCVKTNAYWRERGTALPYPTPHMFIESLDIAQMRELRGADGDDRSWHRYEAVFRAAFQRLQAAGAELGIIASNTPHMRLKGIKTGLDLPIVSILDATAALAHTVGGKRVLILGTPVTMRSAVYPQTLCGYDMEALARPDDEEIAQLEKLIDVDLYQGRAADARDRILEICARHVRDPASDIVCLACTELPLAFPAHQDAAYFSVGGFRFVNTTVAHVEATLKAAL